MDEDLNTGLPDEQIQQAVRVGLKLGATELQVHHSNHLATLPEPLLIYYEDSEWSLSGHLWELKNKGKVQLGNPKSTLVAVAYGIGPLRELFITKFKWQFKWGFIKVIITRACHLRECLQGELWLYLWPCTVIIKTSELPYSLHTFKLLWTQCTMWSQLSFIL